MLILGVAYKADIDDTRESPALKLIELLQDEGAEVSYHDPYVASCPSTGSRRPPLDPAGVGLRRHRHRALGDRLRRARRAGAARRRPAERDRLERDVGTERSGSCDARPRRARGPRLLGPEPRPQLRRARRPALALRPLAGPALGGRRPPSAGPDDDELRRDARRPGARRGRDRDARSSRTTSSPSRRSLAGKHVFVEKPQAQSSAEAEELVGDRAGERPRADARLPPALPPGGRDAEAADRRRRPRRRALPLREPPEPRARSGATRTPSGRSGRTTSR